MFTARIIEVDKKRTDMPSATNAKEKRADDMVTAEDLAEMAEAELAELVAAADMAESRADVSDEVYREFNFI